MRHGVQPSSCSPDSCFLNQALTSLGMRPALCSLPWIRHVGAWLRSSQVACPQVTITVPFPPLPVLTSVSLTAL